MSGKADKEYIKVSLEAHNIYRARHGSPPLKHNDEISKIAQKWADELAAKDAFQHSNNRKYKDGQMGENIAMKWTSSGGSYEGQESVDQWYSEIKDYDFSKSAGPNTGHFTQVVWVGSQEVGFGRAQSASGKWIAVANYYPAGNFVGRYAENVLKSKDGNISVGSVKGKEPPVPVGVSQQGNNPTQGKGTSTKTSTRTETTVKNGKKITKTIVTETTIGPDGNESTTTKETIKTE